MSEIQTRIILGTRESPRFVLSSFYHEFKRRMELYQFDYTLMPATIRYYVSPQFVIERTFQSINSYEIEIDDECLVPHCLRRQYVNANTFMLPQPNRSMDRVTVITENVDDGYFLCLPSAVYFNSNIFRDWFISHLLLDGETWDVHFRHVYVDPHDTRETVWFSTTPRYQIELRTFQDFRERRHDLQECLSAILPTLSLLV